MPKLDLSVRIEPPLGALLGQRFWIPLSAPPSTWPLGSLPVSQAAHFVTEVLCVGQLFLSLSLFLLCQVKNHKLSITPGAEEGQEPVSSRPKSNVSAAAELCPDPEFASLTVVQRCSLASTSVITTSRTRSDCLGRGSRGSQLWDGISKGG